MSHITDDDPHWHADRIAQDDDHDIARAVTRAANRAQREFATRAPDLPPAPPSRAQMASRPPFSPNEPPCEELLDDLTNPQFTLHTVASLHNVPVETLIDLVKKPEVAERITAINAFAQARAHSLATQTLPVALNAIRYTLDGFNHDQMHQLTNPNDPAGRSRQLRARDMVTRASSLLLRYEAQLRVEAPASATKLRNKATEAATTSDPDPTSHISPTINPPCTETPQKCADSPEPSQALHTQPTIPDPQAPIPLVFQLPTGTVASLVAPKPAPRKARSRPPRCHCPKGINMIGFFSHRAAIIAAALAAASSSALAQGPDVIVGDLYEVSNLGGSAGKHAYAVGTISCNLGNQPLTWIDCTNGPNCNVHPAISQNLYRLQDGRFEQIGQAWLKHGFCALQGTVCSTCTPGGSCDALFPGCSDPYSASLNGTQSGLGPKSEINAATGAFPYPWNLQGTNTDNTLFKRLTAADTDLALPGALYFVSSSYIQPEDAASGNDNNNQSYRRVTFSGAPNYTMSLADTTQRTKPAVQAWKDQDASVMITNVDVPGDGRFIIGSKATDIGGGLFRYEYAVQNLNSDRSGQAFSIGLPSGAVVSNIGFKDVDYHSGEPYSLTDWSSTVTSSSITWNTQTFAQNANANALRWDTIYNFRFDCDQAPGTGPATINLFKNGSPGSVSGTAHVPAGGPPPPPVPPANDNCAAAFGISPGLNPFTTVHATTDGPSEPSCSSGSSILNDVWFKYTAPCSGNATFSLCGSAFDTKMALYAGCPSGTSALACNEDSCGTSSEVTMAVTGGTEYLVRIGSATGAMGSGALLITTPNCGPVTPANDNCANAIAVSDGIPVNGTTTGATNDGTATCGTSTTSPDVWYSYTPQISDTVTITTCGTASYDTVLAAFSACGGTQLACADDTAGCSGLTTTITVPMTGGVTYLIRVTGYNGAAGDFTLTTTGGSTPDVPFNDSCTNRAGIGTGPTAFDTRGSFTDGPNHPCGLVENDVWFNFPAQTAGIATFSLCGSTFDTRLAVYDDGGCANLESRLLACNDNFACPSGNGLQSQVSINVVAGRNYTIRVGGANGATGTGTLNVSVAAPAQLILMSFAGNTAIPGVGTVADEDIVSYNPSTNTWAMVFDGSDVGLSALTIDAFAQLQSGDLLLSFDSAATIPTMTGGPAGSATTLDDSDIVRFSPTSLGANTAGSLIFYFDGSDVGLTTNAENIDALDLTNDGRLVMSTSGAFSVTGASGDRQDLFAFTPTSLGGVTAGSFAMYFDGSDVGLTTNAEDVDALAIDLNNNAHLLSANGNFAVTGASGVDEDIFRFNPTTLGDTTAGTFAMHLDLSTLGITSNLTGLELAMSGSGNLLAIDPTGQFYPPATPICDADFNGDEDAGTDADIEAFFACLAGICCEQCGTADFNKDGDFGTDADIESFFRVLAGGNC